MRVDFFIAGVQKSGTTALDALLRRHPGVQMAAVKEPHFFDNEALDWRAPDYVALHAQFDRAASAVVRGEATPIYTYWPNSIERLHAYNPDAKLVIGLRHPAHRAFSHWRMETTRGAETLSFAEAVRAGRERVAQAPDGVHRVFSYVERGFYAPQLARVFEHFPREQVFVFRTDALWRAPDDVLAPLQAFLGLAPMQLAKAGEYIVPLESAALGAMPETDRAYLTDLFAEDVRQTAHLTGLNLSDWLAAEYREPMGS